ncbi:Y-family DNA polymerase [Rhodopila globiformis]|uniref:DNA-directed DNA polymerase n=1 Tax=Rhodopila globiformis TaxID=1071 RepID=A0A2S6NLM0_RHOGL|nr:DNA polymerase Y family protein [Rhodopila globiformis]PPQ36316.1 nucleotidyltransferase [Rhodopila globiformis]
MVTVTGRTLAAVDAPGLRPGMTLALAQALVPGLVVRVADPAGDAAELARLAQWCLRYAPLAAPDRPDGLWIDVSGTAHLHGGEAALLRDLVERLAGQGLRARAAVADTPAVAHAVARYAAGGVVPPGASMPGDLPLEALRLSDVVAAELRLMGFDRIGPLAAVARAPLVRRFGPLLALRLDQAAGRVFEPIVPVAPAAAIQARLGFVEPLATAEAFCVVIARLVAMVCADLERAGQGARRLELRFERVDGSAQALRVGTARPVRDARHLGRMFEERLEQVDPGPGVEAMRLAVAVAEPLGFVQGASCLVGPAAPDLAPLVDRLVNRLGESLVYRIAVVESDVPERSVRRTGVLSPGGSVCGSACWPADWPRPVRLLHPPQPIEVIALLPDHPPVSFTWRQVRHRVRHADGPERIAGEWWKRDREWFLVRDYFRIEDDDGRRFWLFRRGNGSDAGTGDMRWFLHGFF